MMVTLNAGGSSGETSANNLKKAAGSTFGGGPHNNNNNSSNSTSSSTAARSMVAKGAHPLTQRRRRVGKGTLAGYGGGYRSAGGAAADHHPNNSSSSSNAPSTTHPSTAGSSSNNTLKGGHSNMTTFPPAPSTTAASSSSSSAGAAHQPQHSSNNSASNNTDAAAAFQKPCHAARMSILCCQSALRLGARAQLGLCPPGRPRRTLQAALRQRTRASSSSSSMRTPPPPSSSSSLTTTAAGTSTSAVSQRLAVPSASADPAAYYSLERMIGPQSLEGYEDQEEDYLLSTNTFDVESDEEASSGDEDDLNSMDALLAPESPTLDDLSKKYVDLREPLFTPTGADGSMMNHNNNPHTNNNTNAGTAMMMTGMMGSGASGKLPFNRRKIRYFDGITAQDRQAARAYLVQESEKARRRSALLLTRHLRRVQQQERKRRRSKKGETVMETTGNNNDSDGENNETSPRDLALLQGGVAQFEQPMTAAMSAALILESLALNPVESIEGMAKCYDGIVAAGVALIEAQNQDTSALSPSTTSSSHDLDGKDKPKTSRADVLAALAPLLITSLDQPSGDVIVMLARMRRMCGTARYQRRFVQRIAPCLVRPKNAAMWCLRHQHDMEPIVAAVELILDASHEIFGPDWYEKGQLFLADSKRAETLNSAAAQLRILSGEPAPDALSLGLASGHGHHGIRRYMSGAAASHQKDSSKSNDQLSEWEILAVDKEIHLTISKIMSSDWSKVTLNSKDSDSVRSFRSRAPSSKRPGVLPQSASGEASPRAMMISPKSPGRPLGAKAPLSPPPPKDYSSSGPSAENLFENLMPPQPPAAAARPMSPDNAFVQKAGSPMAVSSPPSVHQQGSMEEDLKPAAVPAMTSSTPPRSPKSPMRDGVEMAPPLPKPAGPGPVASSQAPPPPTSPRRSRALSPPSSQHSREETSQTAQAAPFTPAVGASAAAPLSPSSIGSSELVSYRPSSGSSIVSSTGSLGSYTAHYRTLTSTASERKRTVAACRALRAQITRFEDAFIQLHGRPPKGAAERAPLATTYSQYREWKRAIRADAACRIQALFRGARTRFILIRSDNSSMSRIVRNRAGRRDYVSQSADQIARKPAPENLLNQIGIPVEIGEGDPSRSAALKPSPSSSVGGTKLQPTLESFPGQAPGQPLAPQWASQVVRRRAGSADRTPDGFPMTIASGAHSSPVLSSSPHDAATGGVMSLSKLQARKRELKQELKKYDMDFARKHGRMPVKAEKEPIRHLYENYNQLKTQITLIEQEHSRHASAPPPTSVQQLNTIPSAAFPPPSKVMSAPPTPPDSSDSDRSMDSPGLMGGRVKRKHGRSPPVASTSPTPPGAPSADLAALKSEKVQLHQMLRSYEKDFYREHKRQVSSFADIKPVASQYRRYKEIKKSIAALQGAGER